MNAAAPPFGGAVSFQSALRRVSFPRAPERLPTETHASSTYTVPRRRVRRRGDRRLREQESGTSAAADHVGHARQHRGPGSGHRDRRADQSGRHQVKGSRADHRASRRSRIGGEERTGDRQDRSTRRQESVRPGGRRRRGVVHQPSEDQARSGAPGLAVRRPRDHRFRARQQQGDADGGAGGSREQPRCARPSRGRRSRTRPSNRRSAARS